jgi:DNA-binding transcriptional LysR family regulator
VRLGVFATAGAHLVPALVPQYRQRHPETQLVLRASRPEELAAELEAGEIDVGISWDYDFLMRPMGELHRQHLLADPICLLLPRDHPLAVDGPLRLADVADQPWVVRAHKSSRYEDAFEVMCRIAGFEPKIVFRAEDYQSVQGLVAAHVGLAVAPRLSLRAQRPDIVVRELRDPGFARRIDAIALPGYANNPPARQLLSLLEELHAVQGWGLGP